MRIRRLGEETPAQPGEPGAVSAGQGHDRGLAAGEACTPALPPPLPTEQYGDASHPLAEGYKQLAHQLTNDPFFRSVAPAPVGPLHDR